MTSIQLSPPKICVPNTLHVTCSAASVSQVHLEVVARGCQGFAILTIAHGHRDAVGPMRFFAPPHVHILLLGFSKADPLLGAAPDRILLNATTRYLQRAQVLQAAMGFTKMVSLLHQQPLPLFAERI